MKKIVVLILAITIPIFVLLTCTELIVKWDDFFYKQYNANSVEEATTMEIDDLMKVTDEIQDYLLGDREDFLITGVIDGQSQLVFNEREIIHMEDVKDLFNGGIMIRNISFLLILISSIYLWNKDKKALYRSMIYSAIGYFTLGVILGILLLSNFNKYFVIFHEIFFRNDFWMLDPSNSVLINMVNINFFMNIAALILGSSLLIVILIGIFGKIILHKKGNSYER
ncbi:TIGR01906 family membrane protein [Alkalibaculum sporogenes]|uniref:TIGR01906 family membrane protein n=1 Tax=Alkalibaculum sporogenes TaxID=2655001 RepID=UPI00128D35C1